MIKALPIDLTGKLSSLDLVTSLIAEDNQTKDWASAMRVARNGLSHGSRSWNSELLQPAAELLEVIARAQLMRVIGVEATSIRKYLETIPG